MEGRDDTRVAPLLLELRKGWSPDDLLCSRNAHAKTVLVPCTQWKINQPPSLKRERASLEGSFLSFDART